jgi:SAM-dependent methyltransferase
MDLHDLPTNTVPTANAAGAVDAHAAWPALLQDATQPYRQAGRFAWHFARGKLGRDPVFRALLERGWLSPASAAPMRVLDIGCGQGLMASLLATCAQHSQQGRWPAAWGAAPKALQYTGIDLMPRDIARAERALGGMFANVPVQHRFICDDMCRAVLPPSDLVVILDVLHYVDHAAQADVLARVRQSLGQQGRLLLRVGDMRDHWRFAVSQWVDRTVTRIRGHQVAPTWGRALPQWQALLQSLGFSVQAINMSQGTPFANVLLVCEVNGQSPKAPA